MLQQKYGAIFGRKKTRRLNDSPFLSGRHASGAAAQRFLPGSACCHSYVGRNLSPGAPLGSLSDNWGRTSATAYYSCLVLDSGCDVTLFSAAICSTATKYSVSLVISSVNRTLSPGSRLCNKLGLLTSKLIVMACIKPGISSCAMTTLLSGKTTFLTVPSPNRISGDGGGPHERRGNTRQRAIQYFT